MGEININISLVNCNNVDNSDMRFFERLGSLWEGCPLPIRLQASGEASWSLSSVVRHGTLAEKNGLGTFRPWNMASDAFNWFLEKWKALLHVDVDGVYERRPRPLCRPH